MPTWLKVLLAVVLAAIVLLAGSASKHLHTSREFTNEVRTRLFLGGCFSVAAEPPAFCESVPRQSEIAASAEWTINECRDLDAAEISRCSRVMQEVLRYCDAAQARRSSDPQTSK